MGKPGRLPSGPGFFNAVAVKIFFLRPAVRHTKAPAKGRRGLPGHPRARSIGIPACDRTLNIALSSLCGKYPEVNARRAEGLSPCFASSKVIFLHWPGLQEGRRTRSNARDSTWGWLTSSVTVSTPSLPPAGCIFTELPAESLIIYGKAYKVGIYGKAYFTSLLNH
jgi:hypothetical protein